MAFSHICTIMVCSNSFSSLHWLSLFFLPASDWFPFSPCMVSPYALMSHVFYYPTLFLVYSHNAFQYIYPTPTLLRYIIPHNFIVFIMIATLIRVRRNLEEFLICILLVAKDVNLFSSIYWSLICLLLRRVYSVFSPFLDWMICYFEEWIC